MIVRLKRKANEMVWQFLENRYCDATIGRRFWGRLLRRWDEMNGVIGCVPE